MPAALQQKDLLTGRWRKVEAPEPLEAKFHRTLVELLRWRCRPGVVWFHPANGGYRYKATAAAMKGLGVKPGVADLLFTWRPGGITRQLALELKTRSGRQSPAQRAFQREWTATGAIYELARSYDEAVAVLERYDLLRGRG